MAALIRVLTINDRAAGVAALRKSLAKPAFAIPANEGDAQLFGVGTQAALRRCQTKHKLRRKGALDQRIRAVLQRAVGVVESGKNRIEGPIYFDDGRVARDAKLAFYRRGLGGAEVKIGNACA